MPPWMDVTLEKGWTPPCDKTYVCVVHFLFSSYLKDLFSRFWWRDKGMFFSLSTKAVKPTSILCFQKPAMEDKNSLLSLFLFFIVTQTPNHGNWDKAISFKKRSLFKEPEINRQKGSQWWLHSISNFLFVRTELSGGIIVNWAEPIVMTSSFRLSATIHGPNGVIAMEVNSHSLRRCGLDQASLYSHFKFSPFFSLTCNQSFFSSSQQPSSSLFFFHSII